MKELHLVIVSPEKLVYEGKVSQATFPGSAGKFQKISGHGRPCPADFHALGRGSEIRGRTGNAIPANQGGIRGSQGESDFSLCGTLRGAKQAMNRICFWRLSG